MRLDVCASPAVFTARLGTVNEVPPLRPTPGVSARQQLPLATTAYGATTAPLIATVLLPAVGPVSVSVAFEFPTVAGGVKRTVSICFSPGAMFRPITGPF